MKTNITFDLKIGFFQNQSMVLQIESDDELILPPTQFSTLSDVSLNVSVSLPVNLKINVSGRHPGDTAVDQNGCILQDKYIHLQNIVIFETKIETYKMPQNILLYKDVDGNIIEPSYFWNCNGEITLSIDDADPLFWLLKHHEVW
jgi:hypothetical protein